MLNKDERKILATSLKSMIKVAIALELDKINANMTQKVAKTIKEASAEIAKDFVKKSHEEAKKLRKEEEKKNKKPVISNVALEGAHKLT